MEQNTHTNTPTLTSSYPKDHTPYLDLIIKTVKGIHQHLGAPNHIDEEVAGFIIYSSFLISETEDWKRRFILFRKYATEKYTTSQNYWRTIARGVSTPEVERVCLELLPNLDKGKYFPDDNTTRLIKRIALEHNNKPKRNSIHKRGELWRLDRRWDRLWPSSRKVFIEICRRSQKPKRPFAFPWCQAGIPSLSRFTRVSECQVKRSLHQLQNRSLIKRIVRGYEGTRGSKYYVFLTPKMSGAFCHKSPQKRKHQRPPLYKMSSSATPFI